MYRKDRSITLVDLRSSTQATTNQESRPHDNETDSGDVREGERKWESSEEVGWRELVKLAFHIVLHRVLSLPSFLHHLLITRQKRTVDGKLTIAMHDSPHPGPIFTLPSHPSPRPPVHQEAHRSA